MNFLRKHQAKILWGVLAFFVVGICFQLGGGFFQRGSLNDAVATVDGNDITIREFLTHYNRAIAQLKPGVTLDKAGIQQKQQEVLRDLVQAEVFRRQSAAYGIHVPDAQVVNSIAGIPQLHNDKGNFDPQLYGRFLQYQARETPNEFEEEQRQSIAFFKLRYLIQSCVKITDAEFAIAWAERGGMFAKTNADETSADGKTKHRRTPAEVQTLFRQQLNDEKSMWALNQWFSQIGQKLVVKPHLDRLEAGGN